MTDPIQWTNPPQNQQNTQQWPIDDILGGEDIFAAIPDNIQTPVVAPIQQEIKVPVEPVHVPEIPPTQDVTPHITDEEMQDIQQQSSIEQIKVEDLLDTKLQTDVQKKFGELFFTTKKIYELKDKIWNSEETFDILWADNDKIFISYRFLLDETDDPMIFITKIEQEKETEEETVNELRFTFNEENSSIEVMINDTLLFDEHKDFTEDPKKKMQVIDKLNKFIFLTSEELRKVEKEIKDKEEMERERRKLQEVFRNF